MKTATGLTLIAIGAVLAFAVRGHPGFLNLQVVGWILMIIGVIGMVIPRSGYGWLRRRMVVRRGPAAQQRAAIEPRNTPYIMINPAAAEAASGSVVGTGTSETDEFEEIDETEVPVETRRIPTARPKSWASGDDVVAGSHGAGSQGADGKAVPDEEVVEEYFRE